MDLSLVKFLFGLLIFFSTFFACLLPFLISENFFNKSFKRKKLEEDNSEVVNIPNIETKNESRISNNYLSTYSNECNYYRKISFRNLLLDCISTFSGGVFLGAFLLHMFPEVIENFDKSFPTKYPLPFFLIGVGFFVFLLTS